MQVVQLEHVSSATNINDAVNLMQQLEASQRDNQKLINIREKISGLIGAEDVEKPVFRGYKKKLNYIQARVNNAQQTTRRLSDQVEEFRSEMLQSMMKQVAQIYETVQSDCERISDKFRASTSDQQKPIMQQQTTEVNKNSGSADRRRIKKVEHYLLLQFKKMQSVRETVFKQTREQVQLAVHAGLLEDQLSEQILAQYANRLEIYANVTGSQVQEMAERVQLLDERYKHQQFVREKAVKEVKQRIANLKRDFNKLVKSIRYMHQEDRRISRNSQVYSNNSISPQNGRLYKQKPCKQDQLQRTPRSTLSTIDDDTNQEWDATDGSYASKSIYRSQSSRSPRLARPNGNSELDVVNAVNGMYRSQSSRSPRQARPNGNSEQDVVNAVNGMYRSQSSRSVRKLAPNSPRDMFKYGTGNAMIRRHSYGDDSVSFARQGSRSLGKLVTTIDARPQSQRSERSGYFTPDIIA